MNKSYNTEKIVPRVSIWRSQYDNYSQNIEEYGGSTVWNAEIRKSIKVATATPNWKALVKSGARLKPLPYLISESVTLGEPWGSYDVGSMKLRSKAVVGTPRATVVYYPLSHSNRATWYYVDDYMSPPLPAPLVQQARNLAVLKLLAEIKDGKVNLAQAYAESSQVHKLIGETAIKLAGVFQHLRKGQLLAAASILGLRVGKRKATRYTKSYQRAKDPASIENMLANGVLAVQYGIKPLISDVIGAAELLAQKVSREIVSEARVSKTLRFNDQKSKTKVNATWNSYEPYTVSAQCQSSCVVRVKVQVTYAKGNELVHTAKQMGMSNIPLLAWELLPWSFVIDWFIPIGNYLSTLDATLGLDFVEGHVSTKYDIHHVRSQVVNGGVSIPYSSSSFRESKFQREVLTSFPTATFPSFKNPVSIEHAINAIALLVGVKNGIIKDFHRGL